MPKEIDFFNATSAGDSTTAKVTDSIGSSGSTLARYRVTSRPNNVGLPSSTDKSPSRSPENRPCANAPSLLMRLSKNSMSRLPLTAPGSAEPSSSTTTGKSQVPGFVTVLGDAAVTSGGAGGTPKLPQKLRQHVNRLRGQFVLGSASSRNLNTNSRAPSPTISSYKVRSSVSSAATPTKRFSLAAAAVQYSHRSRQFQQFDVSKGVEEPAAVKENLRYESGPIAKAATFQDLIRPLQNSLSCASLSSEWSSDEDDEAEQVFRQSERENSHMLRVCCSIDNLLLSISDQAQEQKHNESIVRGATRELVKLFQFGIKQVVSVVFGKDEHQAGNNNLSGSVGMKLSGNEAQYAMEFLLEVADRIGKLDEFTRNVFVGEVDLLRGRTERLEGELADAKQRNERLQNEMRDLRDFHEHSGVNGTDAFASDHSDTRFPVVETQNNEGMIPDLAFTPDLTINAEESECDVLKQQCQELSRLLDMAKQEIRMSHHERDIHKARVAEISSALFHDNELGLLRNQLQSEKKRVRVLERENLALRENQQDQALKLQSLQNTHTGQTASASAGSEIALSSTTQHGSDPSIVATVSDPSPALDSSTPHNLTQSLTLDCEGDRYNFVTGSSEIGQGAAEVAPCNWFSRIVNPQPSGSPRKTKTVLKDDQQSSLTLSKFLAGLMMTDKQLLTAQAGAKTRRQAKVPSIDPPIGALAARRQVRSVDISGARGKRQRPRSATSTVISDTVIEVEDSREEVITLCLQLVWVFYQRFMLAVESQQLLETRDLGDATLGSHIPSAGATEPVALSQIVLHFFLERCAREADAMQELEQFVRCLHSVRDANFSLELFCQFLENTRSHRELCFFLWVCQATDNLTLGVPYQDPLPSSGAAISQNDQPVQYICALKATFLARAVFRVLHFRVLCRPPATGGKRHRKKDKRSLTKPNMSNAAAPAAPLSPSSSPKRKPKTRIGEVTAALASQAADPGTTNEHGEQRNVLPHVAAQTALREIIEAGHGQPVTLESFNNLLLQFSVIPSTEELIARLGSFYRPTGDERKIPMDVFLALLMEMYRFQVQWQRDQLCALFLHIKSQEGIQQRTSKKLGKSDTSATAPEDRRKNGGNKQKPVTSSLRIKRSRGRMTENGVGSSKYLRGLSRHMLRELLVQSGIVNDADLAHFDIDWMFASLVESAGGNAADITFDSLFETLHKMRWLDNKLLQVGAFVQVSGVAPTKEKSASLSKSLATPADPELVAVREKWRVYARQIIAMCSNDPNVFIRQHCERLLHCVDHCIVTPTAESDCAQSIREFLAFAWRVAAKRSSGGSRNNLMSICLTEIFFVCQALRTCTDTVEGYVEHTPMVSIEASHRSRPHCDSTMNGLHSFYDTSRMRAHLFVRSEGTEDTRAQLLELENVLTLYAAHIAHLFERFSEARFNSCAQVPFYRWKAMTYELRLVHPRCMPFQKLEGLFVSAVETFQQGDDDCSQNTPLDQVGIGKAQFSELFVLIALERHRVITAQKVERRLAATAQKRKETIHENEEATLILDTAQVAERPARVMALFCREVIAPRAFEKDNTLVERNFAAKRSCPLVCRALLEHRAFLRSVFFFYAKQDEVAAERAALEQKALLEQPREHGEQVNGADQNKDAGIDSSTEDLPTEEFHLEKTKRSSMSFEEFQTFLTTFGLLDSAISSPNASPSPVWTCNKLALANAQHVFASVMGLDNDDTEQLEFDEFAAAVVALAVFLSPSPFTLWHEKLDEFVASLRRAWQERKASSNEK